MATLDGFLRGHIAVLERVATGQPLREVLDALVALIEAGSDNVCSIVLLDEDGRHVRPIATRSLPPEYVTALDGLEIGPAAGSCGTALFRKETVIVEDIETDPLWAPYRHLALPHGWHACWSSPIFAPDGSVLGTFAMYHPAPRGPTSEELARVDTATHLAAIAIVRDRSQRALLRSEQEVRDSEERLRNVVEHTPNVAIQWYDAEGRVTYCNEASLRIYGWQRDEMIGHSLDDVGFFATEADSEAFRALRRRALAGETPPPVELSFVRPDGGVGVVLSTVFRIPDRRGGWQLVCMDVELTQLRAADARRRELEQQLHQGQRLQALGTLASGIAHDFNNVLGAIAANADFALHATERADAEVGLREIQKATKRAAELVKQILTFGRKRVARREASDLRSLVEEAVGLVRASLPRRIAIETWLAPEPLVAAVDTTQLYQVLINVITNAAHAIGDETGAIRIGVVRAPTKTDVAITVRDTGHGMDGDTISRVFDPFFTTKPPGEGTGLGLPIVKDIIDSHGGTIAIDSEVGRGTTVSLYLPLAPA